jgi:hypothetical protein
MAKDFVGIIGAETGTTIMTGTGRSKLLDTVYAGFVHRYIGIYMRRIGVTDWEINEWQPIIWYDGKIRVIPQTIIMNEKNLFIYNLAGGTRACLDHVFAELDSNKIYPAGVQL